MADFRALQKLMKWGNYGSLKLECQQKILLESVDTFVSWQGSRQSYTTHANFPWIVFGCEAMARPVIHRKTAIQ